MEVVVEQVHLHIEHWTKPCVSHLQKCKVEKQYKFVVDGIEYIVSRFECFDMLRRFTGRAHDGPIGLAASEVSRASGHEIISEKSLQYEIGNHYFKPEQYHDRRPIVAYHRADGPGARNYLDLTATIERFGPPDRCVVCNGTGDGFFRGHRDWRKDLPDPICGHCSFKLEREWQKQFEQRCFICSRLFFPYFPSDSYRHRGKWYCTQTCREEMARNRKKLYNIRDRRRSAERDIERLLLMERK